MEPNVLNEGCDVFINETNIKFEEIEGESWSKEISNSQSKMMILCN
jgi:hypothetical protein